MPKVSSAQVTSGAHSPRVQKAGTTLPLTEDCFPTVMKADAHLAQQLCPVREDHTNVSVVNANSISLQCGNNSPRDPVYFQRHRS